MTTGKTVALITWTVGGKVTSLLFNVLSRLVIASLSRSKRLLISRLQSLSAVILEPKKRKSVTASTFSPSVCHEMMGPDTLISFFMFSFKQAFSPSSRGCLVPPHFPHQSDIMCISEVLDISPGNLDSSL